MNYYASMYLYVVPSSKLCNHGPHRHTHTTGTTMSRRVMRGFDPEDFTRARISAGLSRQDLARLSRTGRATIDNWENGKATPQIDALVRVAAVLNLTPESFIKIPPDRRYPGDWRVIRGLTQPQLAAATALSTTTIGAIERGEVALTDSNAATIAAILDLTPAAYRAAYERARTRPPGTPA